MAKKAAAKANGSKAVNQTIQEIVRQVYTALAVQEFSVTEVEDAVVQKLESSSKADLKAAILTAIKSIVREVDREFIEGRSNPNPDLPVDGRAYCWDTNGVYVQGGKIRVPKWLATLEQAERALEFVKKQADAAQGSYEAKRDEIEKLRPYWAERPDKPKSEAIEDYERANPP